MGYPNHTQHANCTAQLETYLRPYSGWAKPLTSPIQCFSIAGILPKQRAMGSDIDTPLAGKSMDREAYAAEDFI